MPRGNRRILAAIAGLILLGAAPQHGGKDAGEKTHSQSEPSQRAPAVALSPGKAVEEFDSPVLAKPCQPSQDNRNSDLCAQWKAADAASNAAWWAMVVTFVTALGTIGLYWQIKLTREAVQDTGKATNAMERQNSLASAAQRAWLVIEPKIIKASVDGNRLTLDWGCWFTNKGGTVAKNVKYTATFKMMDEKAFDLIPKEYDRMTEKFKNREFNMIPGENVWSGGSLMQSVKHIKWTGAKPYVHMLLLAVARYQVEGDDEWHVTGRAFAVSLKDEDFAFRWAVYQESLDRFATENVEAVPFGQSVST